MSQVGQPDKNASLTEVLRFYPLAYSQADTIRTRNILIQRDLRQDRINATISRDSMAISLDMMGRHLERAMGDEAKWYQDPSLWFLIGAGTGIIVTGQVLQITF